MEFRQLRYFVAVVENGTVLRAAQMLHMSQPPMTAQIHALEQELGCALFEHSGRRLRLTENGQAFYLRAKAILDQCQAARFAMADLRAGATGILRVGVISSFSGPEFIRWIDRFSRENPGIRYEIREANTYQLLSLLRQRVIDLAVIRTPFSASDVAVHTLRTETLQAVGAPHFFTDLPAQTALSLKDLADKPLLIYRRWEPIFRDRFSQLGLEPYIQCVSDSATTTLSLARMGLGVGLMPASAIAEGMDDQLHARSIDAQEFQSDLDLVYLKDADLSSPAMLFVKMLQPE